jgi:hypothetical protein
MQLKIAETADFQGFGMARKPVPFGRAMVFYIPAVAAPSCVPAVASEHSSSGKGTQRHKYIMVHMV